MAASQPPPNTNVEQNQSSMDSLFQLWGIPGTGLDSKGTAIPAPDWATQLLTDELDAGAAGDVYGSPMGGFKFPAGMSIADFKAIETLAHTYAANSNWRYMPTGRMILAAYNAHITNPQQAYSMWFNALPVAEKGNVPWLAYGMNQQNYLQSSGGLIDSLEKLTGSRDTSNLDPAIMQQAISQGWSTAHMESALRSSLSQTSPWLAAKYGYDYKTWQDYKTANRSDIVQRYGLDRANQDQLYLQNHDNPLATSEQARGSSVGYESGSNQKTFYNKASALDFSQSEVR